MSGNKHQNSFSPERKRRRVLQEIVNIEEPYLSEKDRSRSPELGQTKGAKTKSIDEVDCLEVKTSSTQDKENFTLEAPKPSSLADMNTKGSSIPTLRKSDTFERFLAINKSLDRKSTINGFGGDLLASALQTHETRGFGSRAISERLRQESTTLDIDLIEARRKLSYIQDEAFETRKLHRALQNERSMLKAALGEEEGKFEFLSGLITMRVETQEREIQAQLEDYERKAQASYNEVKSEVKAELEKALKCEDEETSEELLALEKVRAELQEKLQKVTLENEERIKAEKMAMQAEYERITNEINEEVSDAEQKLLDLQLEHDSVAEENQKLQAAVSSEEEAGQRTKKEISALEHIIQNYVISRKDMESKFQHEQEFYHQAKNRADAWKEKEAAAKRDHDQERSKYDSYIYTRCRLEHAISKLSDKNRVLVRVKDFTETEAQNQISNYTNGLHRMSGPESDYEFSKNWELLTQESISNERVMLIFSGSFQNDICSKVSSVFGFVRRAQDVRIQNGWSYDVVLQSLFITGNNQYSDLFNPSSEVSINSKNDSPHIISQKMLVKSVSDIASVLQNTDSRVGVFIHLFSISGTNTEEAETSAGSVWIVDISRLTLHAQAQLLSLNVVSSDTDVERKGVPHVLPDLLKRSSLNYRNMDICDIEDREEPGAQALLSALEACVVSD